METCKHHDMYFENGMLHCSVCGEDKTPLPRVRVHVVFSDYREKILKDIEKVIDGLPEDVLKDIELYAEYLKWRRKNP